MGAVQGPCLCMGFENLGSGFYKCLLKLSELCLIKIIYVFQNLRLTSLYKIQLQYNHIGTIDLHAFLGVTELRILDLSYNHLYYLLPATFEDTPQLRSLYLQGNRLKIYPGPILTIPSLEV